jgi:hypothetical protein
MDINTLIVHCNIIHKHLEQEEAESYEKNTHVQIFELIESFDSNSWLCVCSLCTDVMLN